MSFPNDIHLVHGEEAEVGTTKLHPVGTRGYTDNDRVFRYCYAGSNIAIPSRGVANASPHLEGTCIGNAVAGAYTLDLPPACADFTEDVIYNTADIYENGYVWIMGDDGDPAEHEFHKILSNEALDSATSTYVRVTLESPIAFSQDTPWITAYRNVYANCQQDYPNSPTYKQAVVCMTSCGVVVTAGQYFWGQTWGPCWTTAYNATPGLATNDRELIFMQGGTIAIKREMDPTTYSHQRAGYVLTNTENTGDMFFQLQLAS